MFYIMGECHVLQFACILLLVGGIFSKDQQEPTARYKGYHCKMLHATCPKGWTGWGNFCYKTIDQPMQWQPAVVACTAIGGWLAVPNTSEENAFMLSMATADTDGVWINCTDLKTENTWECLEQNKLVINLQNWALNEPDDAASNEDCSVIEAGDKKWHDVICDYKEYSVVCKQHTQILQMN